MGVLDVRRLAGLVGRDVRFKWLVAQVGFES
jgi:hypothetical protein